MPLFLRRFAWRAVVLAGLALAGALTGCAVSPTVPRITGLSPSLLQQGRPARLSLQVQDWTADSQLALLPAGPYVTHDLGLTAAPLALASDGVRAFVATAGRRLLVVDFPDNNPAGRVLARLPLSATPRQLVYVHQHLLMALADGSLQWWSVADNAPPSLLTSVAIPAAVQDMQVADGRVYLLLDEGEGHSGLQRWRVGSGRPQREAQWSLPLSAHAFALRGQRVWAVDDAGLALVDISGHQAKLIERRNTGGAASDVQLQDNLALLAVGQAGLVVFDISDPQHLQWRGSFNKRGAITGFAAQGQDVLLNLAQGGVLRLGLGNPELPRSGAAHYTSTPVTASTLHGDVALLASGKQLQRVLMLGEGDGAISAEGLNLGGSRRGVIRDDILYVADWFSGLHLYGISDPRRLRHLGNYHTPGSSKGVALLDHYALVGDDDQGLQIIDIADPQRPRWVAELPPEAMARLGLAYTMDLVGKTLYLADHRGGFHIIDLSDIHRPRRIGGYDTPGKAWDIAVQDKVAFVADDRGGLLMFDVSEPAQPVPFTQFNPNGQAEDVLLHDGMAYVAFFDQGVYVLDVHDPRHARVVGHIATPGNARGLALDGRLLYVASWEAGLQIVDVRDPSQPRIVGTYDTDGAAWGVNVQDGYAYVLDWWGGIKIVDVRRPTQPLRVDRYQARETLVRMGIRGNYLFAASGEAGLQVYDIKNPLNPIWVTGVDLAGRSQDVWLEDHWLYLATGEAGVAILDILDPFYTHAIGHYRTPGRAQRILAHNDYMYVVDDQAGLLVLDARDPQRPTELARYALQAHDLWLDEDTLWMVDDAGLSAWAVADDGRLSRRASVAGGFTQVRAQGGLVVTATRAGAVQLWSDTPQGVRLLATYPGTEPLLDLQLDGASLLLLSEHQGLQMVDLQVPERPRLRSVYPPTGRHRAVVSARGAAFFAGERKLASVSLLPSMSITATPGTTQAGELTVRLPDNLPLGEYHLQTVNGQGQRQLFPRAFRLQFAPPGGKNATLDAFRRLLQTPLKPPPEVDTALPTDAP